MKSLLLICAVLFVPLTVCAQGFSSGSTGADGPLDLSTCNTYPCIVQLPDSGVLHYTTVNIPYAKTLVFKRNSRNTPVYMLAQGDVNIGGFIDVSAGNAGFSSGCVTSSCEGKVPGPGGFYGGDAGQAGFGPGGGQLAGTTHGQWVGPLSLVPILGGSGGAGDGGLGGGGGGALVIASSTSIVLAPSSVIVANGARVFGSLGSGGAIRLVANSLNVGGALRATDNLGSSSSRLGVIRLEGGTINFTGTSTPAAVLSPVNSAIVSSTQPTLRIVSIGGSSVPSYAGSRFDTVDLLLANQLQDPIAVQVAATNIPVGTQITIGFFGSPSATTTPGTLSGSLENSTATATISGLNRAVPTYLLATAVFDPPASASLFNPPGPNHVARVRVEAKVWAKPALVFLRKNGTVVESAKLQKSFLALLGQ